MPCHADVTRTPFARYVRTMTTATPPCALCGSYATRLFYHDEGRVTVWQCQACGVGFNHRAAGIEDHGGLTATKWETTDKTLRLKLGEQTADIRRAIARHVPRGRLLDAGCGRGEFLASVDPARYERVG